MNDDLNDLEERLARHDLPQPPDELRRRIAALPRAAKPAFAWHSIAAAVLAVLALLQMVASTARRAPLPYEAPPPREALATTIRQLDLPLNDQETRQLANTLAAGARLQPLPELHGKLGVELSLGGIP